MPNLFSISSVHCNHISSEGPAHAEKEAPAEVRVPDYSGKFPIGHIEDFQAELRSGSLAEGKANGRTQYKELTKRLGFSTDCEPIVLIG